MATIQWQMFLSICSSQFLGQAYVQSIAKHILYCILDSILTFQHFDCNLGDSVWLLFVETQCLTHHYLAEAAFTQRLPKNKSVSGRRHMDQH